LSIGGVTLATETGLAAARTGTLVETSTAFGA